MAGAPVPLNPVWQENGHIFQEDVSANLNGSA